MKLKPKYFLYTLFIVFTLIFIMKNNNPKSNSKEKHALLIDNHPFQKDLKLSKTERKANGIAPNKYFEQEHLLEINPATGKTYPEKIFSLQSELNNNNTYSQRSVPGSNGSDWIERGPDNVPGRTRAVMYDPNDTTHKRVFAGGVSGGLWVIDDIEDSNSSWQRVDIPENLSITCITTDINDSNTFYVGTGEAYVAGDVNGNGVWKSTDGGNSWTHIFGGSTGTTQLISDGGLNINSGSITGNYAAVQTSSFGAALTSITADLVIVDDGTANPVEGCNPLTNGNLINGKIAVIDRGTCQFIVKVKHAQDQGAIAAIIFNSVPSFPFNMAGEDATITIPAVMMGQADGTIIKNAINIGTVNATLNPITTTLPTGIVLIPGKFHINDIVTRNNNNITEIYAAVTESAHINSANLLGGEIGLYKSVNGGNTWVKVNLPNVPGETHSYAPNDLLITSNNKLWVATTNSWSFGDGGGTILSSTDGINFTIDYNESTGRRTQIAASSTNPDLIYVLMQGDNSTPILIKKTTNGFTTNPTNLVLPNDPVLNANDFTGGQGFYNLTISVRPDNDQFVTVGGINTFRSNNGGASWNKTSWSRQYTSGISNIHADVHSIIFNPWDNNKGLIGTDGGVFHVNNWTATHVNSNAMQSRGNDYNTTQFYHGAISQNTSNEKILGGAQDNGSNFINNASSGINSSIEIGGGDGMYCFIDKNSNYLITSIYQNSYYYRNMSGTYQNTIVNNQNEGSFVNVAELDDNLNILYSDAHTRNSDGSFNAAVISRFTNLSNPSRTNLTNALLTRTVTALRASGNGRALYVGTDTGSILKLTNPNTSPTWSDLTPEPYDAAFSGSISSIRVDRDELLVTFHNYGVVNVYYSDDAGSTWQNKEGDLPDLPVKDILMNPLLNDEVIIATDLGVWKTINFSDANPHWVRSQNGMQNVKVTSFDLRTADNTILATTYGRGFFTGQFTNTDTSSIDGFNTTNNIVSIYPTVSNGEFFIKSSSNLDNSTIQVYDINGRQVFNTKMNINASSKSINLNVNQGVYFVNIIHNDLKESHKIIIE